MGLLVIVPQLAHLAVPIDSIEPHPDNPNRGDVEVIRALLRAHGQHTPVVVQASTRRIVAGHHTWMAAKAEGWTEVAASLVDYDDLEALEVLLGDNRPSRLGRTNDYLRAGLVVQAEQAGRLERTGYTRAAMADLLRRVREDMPEPEPEDEPENPRALWPTIRVECSHETYAEWTALVRRAGSSEDLVLADLIVRAS